MPRTTAWVGQAHRPRAHIDPLRNQSIVRLNWPVHSENMNKKADLERKTLPADDWASLNSKPMTLKRTIRAQLRPRVSYNVPPSYLVEAG